MQTVEELLLEVIEKMESKFGYTPQLSIDDFLDETFPVPYLRA
jgi:hypothetical protein